MNLGLKNKVAIITGASKGIGRAIALSLAQEGAKVVICSRTKPALIEAQKVIRKLGCEALAVVADVTKPGQVKKVIATTIKQFGRLDILVNNAGGAQKFGDFASLTSDDWLKNYELNVVSVVNCEQAALPYLKKVPCARIIQVSSISGLKPGLYNPHYAAAKAAMINLSSHLAKTLAKDKILVNTVCAGPVHSEAWDRNLQYVAKLKKQDLNIIRREFETQEASKVPLGRVGEGHDIAGMVTFLASEQAAWITGSCFVVDGGKL